MNLYKERQRKIIEIPIKVMCIFSFYSGEESIAIVTGYEDTRFFLITETYAIKNTLLKRTKYTN